MKYTNDLFQLMGYHTKPMYDTRSSVLNKNDEVVGFVQYKVLRKKNIKEGLPVSYAYFIEIEDGDYSYRDIIPENQKNKRNSFNMDFGDNKENNVKIYFSDYYVSFIIRSREHGYIEFLVGDDVIHGNFRTKTEKHMIEEVIRVEFRDSYASRCAYTISYCDVNEEELDASSDRVSFQIYGDRRSHHDKEILVTELTWKNGVKVEERKNKYEASIEEMISKLDMIADAYKRLTVKIDQILPFEEDILTIVKKSVEQKYVEQLNLLNIDNQENVKKHVYKKEKVPVENK